MAGSREERTPLQQQSGSTSNLQRESSYMAPDDGFEWDLCFVKNVDEGSTESVRINELEAICKRAGLTTCKYPSVQQDEIYLKLHIRAPVLRRLAAENEFLIECDPTGLKDMCERMPEVSGGKISKIDIPSRSETSYQPYEFIFAEYQCEASDPAADTHKNVWKLDRFTKSPFGKVSRLQLLKLYLEAPVFPDRGCGLDLLHEQEEGLTVFPLHTDAEREYISSIWLGWCRSIYQCTFGSQPVNELKDYLGPKMTLYIAFLGTVSPWLFGLGVLGAMVEAVNYQTSGGKNLVIALFAVVAAIWSTLFTEYWKRTEARLQVEWGMSDFEHSEPVRMAYRKSAEVLVGGDDKGKRHSIITGKLEYDIPWEKTIPRRIYSAIIIFICIVAIGLLNVYLYALKLNMKNSSNAFLSTWYSYIFSAMVSVSISVVNVLYTNIAVALTEAESHRTDTEHLDSLIFKLFIVQFINSYASLYYVAFAMKHLEGDCDGYTDCVDDLTVLVATILLERLMFTLLYDNWLPRLLAYRRFLSETAGVETQLSEAETQFILDPLDKDMETVNRFMDQILMFGYMVLFVTSFPMAPFVGFMSNIVQIQEFGNTLLYRKRRVIPGGVQDIGTFQVAFEAVAEIAIITNSALVFFTMKNDLLPQWSTLRTVWYFFLVQVFIFKVVESIKQIVPDVPYDVFVQLARQEFLRKKVFEMVHDPVFTEPDVEEEPAQSFAAGTGGVFSFMAFSSGSPAAEAKKPKSAVELTDTAA